MKNGAGLTLFLAGTTLISGMLAAFYLWRLKRQQSALAMREHNPSPSPTKPTLLALALTPVHSGRHA